FLMRADALLEALHAHAPEILAASHAAHASASRHGPQITPGLADLAACPAQSIDYAVLEHAARVAVAPVDMGWSDIGSWDALRAIEPADAQGNAVRGDVVAIDTRGCLLRSDGPILATIGVTDLIIVATEDAVLVSAAGASQDVRQIVDALAGNAALNRPRRESHGWGTLRRLTEGAATQVFEATLDAGANWQSPAAALTVLDGAVIVDGQALACGERRRVDAGASVTAAAAARLLVVTDTEDVIA
ncbi:MAG: hypothetical protein ACRCUI_08400, partial [Polymorphobacter sp.]